jgi:hypothetical protein
MTSRREHQRVAATQTMVRAGAVRLFWGLGLCVAASPAAAIAQAELVPWTGYVDVRHRNDCRLAQQVLTLGQPAGKREWALDTIPACGPMGAEAVSRQLLAAAAAGDTAALRVAVRLSSGFVHPDLFEAGAQLAERARFGPVVRVHGLRVLFMQIQPTFWVGFDEITQPPFGDDFARAVGRSTNQPSVQAGALPNDAGQRAASIGLAIIRDSGNARELRNAAYYVAVIGRELHRERLLCAGTDDEEECSRLLLAQPDTMVIPAP